ncbi:hypothetical protein Dda_9176 [Drechslerella dactyloides]|uniref:Glutathione S-transferase n=1 Tax=Drechslerella dactyloides TaxID=74499 RepID=A0AAD6IQP9_DREDA|nr:hypothetical protein Dda_9176 [Drechslerella dactyloides]
MTGTETAATTTPSSKPSVTLIWLNESRAQRIAWLLEEMGLDYDLKVYKRTKEKQAPAELKEYHPLGKAPMVVVDDKTLVESAFIVEYLVDNYAPQLKPAESDSKQYMQYRHLMHYTEGSLMPFMLLAYVCMMIRNTPVPFFVRPITNRVADGLSNTFVNPNLVSNYDWLETLLKDQPFFAGDKLTGADIMLSFPIESAQERMGGFYNKERYPNLFSWVERIKARPAYKNAEEKVAAVEANL